MAELLKRPTFTDQRLYINGKAYIQPEFFYINRIILGVKASIIKASTYV